MTDDVGVTCRSCGVTREGSPALGRCPECDGRLVWTPAYDAIDLDRESLAGRPFDSLWRYHELLPFDCDVAITMDEGATPLVDCPRLADELGVEEVLIKDEGRNPTGAATDRQLSLAVTAAVEAGATEVALASTGTAGQSAAAYAGRAGLGSHVFLPSRSSFATKAMVNVHGGEMSVVGGRYPDAVAACREALAEHDDWHSLAPVSSPFRLAGATTLTYEICEQCSWNPPDAIIVPTGNGIDLVGAAHASAALTALGLIDERPPLYAAQATGCAPLVEAFEVGAETHEPVETPDTICGDLEVPDPPAGDWALEAIRESGGGAVSCPDDEILEAAVAVATHEGLEMSPSAGTAAAAAWHLAEEGVFDGDETIVLVSTAAGNREADLLRSHLMSQGV